MGNWVVLAAPKEPRKMFLLLSTRYNEIFENWVCPLPNDFSLVVSPQNPILGACLPQPRFLIFAPGFRYLPCLTECVAAGRSGSNWILIRLYLFKIC